MPLLASAHFISMSYESTRKYRPPTSIHSLLMGTNFCLDHVILREVFMITTNYHKAMPLLASAHFISIIGHLQASTAS